MDKLQFLALIENNSLLSLVGTSARVKKLVNSKSLLVCFKSGGYWQSYKQEHDCLVHLNVRLANTLLKDGKVHKTITFYLVTLPNIHRLKNFHSQTQQ